MEGAIASKDIGLYVNTGTDAAPQWDLIGCSTSDGFSGTTEEVDIATKCDDGWTSSLPGDSSWEFSNSSYAKKTAELETNQVSYETAESIFHGREVKQFKLASADETYYRMGKGFITSYNETADQGDYLQFDLTIKGVGDYSTTAPTT